MSHTTSIWASPPRMRMDTKQMVIELARLKSKGQRLSVNHVAAVHIAIENELKKERKKHAE